MRRAILVLGAAAALSGAGCGRDDDPRAADPQEAELAFAQCMRDAGIAVPDPRPGDGPQRVQIARHVAPQTVERTARRCRDRTGAGRVLEPDERAELHDRLLSYARCMRARGVRIPDPEVDQRGGALVLRRRGAGDPGIDAYSPAFRRADAACHDRLPHMGG